MTSKLVTIGGVLLVVGSLSACEGGGISMTFGKPVPTAVVVDREPTAVVVPAPLPPPAIIVPRRGV